MATMWNEDICSKLPEGDENYATQRAAAGCGQDDIGRVEDSSLYIINVALGIIGLVAVIFIIVGGVQYVTSAGDSGKAAKARNTILYSVIGLIVAILAFAIVNFVLDAIL